MSDSGNSLASGFEIARGLSADERKAAAYNTLKNTYGDAIADNPQNAETAANASVAQQTIPTKVQQAQSTLDQTNLQNTGLSQTNTYNAQANPLRLKGLDLTNQNTSSEIAEHNATTTRTNTLLPGEVRQQGAQLNETRAQTGLAGAEAAHANVETQQGRFSLNTQQAAQDRQSAMGILASLSDVASAGGDVGSKFDQLAPLIAKYEGIDQSHMAPLRDALVKDPVGTINRLSDAIQAANLTAAGANGKGAAGALQMMKFSAGQMSLKDGLNFTAQRTGAVPGLVDQMNALVPQMHSLATLRKAYALVPGTPEYQFHQLAEQLTPNLSLEDLRTLKASGTSLGRVTNQEMSMAGNAIANMDLGQDTSTLNANLKRIKTTYGIVNNNVQADIQRIGTGGGVPGVPRATQPASQGSKLQEGGIYTDAKGNKAKFQSGQWVPVN